MRIKSTPNKNAEVAQNSTTAARRITGLARILTRAPCTSAGKHFRRKRRRQPCCREIRQKASGKSAKPFAPTAIRGGGRPAHSPGVLRSDACASEKRRRP